MTHLTVITGPMFSGKSEELIRRLRRAAYAHIDITIIISGLDMDAWRKPFGVMPELMSMADHVLKFAAICLRCEGKYGPGIFTQKKTSSTLQVEVGDEEIYEARCRACHTLPS